MPKFYGQNKKRIDPRYFLNETTERGLREAVIEPGLTKGGKWPGVSNQARAQGLAQRGMEQAATQATTGESPPWEKQDECGDGFTDARLEEKDFEVLEWILNDLQIGSGRGNMAQHFLGVMQKLGISLKGKGPLTGQHGVESDWSNVDPAKASGRNYSGEEEEKIRSSILGSMAKNPPSTPWSKGR